ncbi:MAG: RHS repeat protein [Candidatus Thiodiazotropha sp. (ex Myrtea sp. 'scaly one' KF741663)]|nr:RHS repeat protein [Candidatus Thiodiazotropha sp. (ex Myrtea sp. 'scaly one' KF741663)]
MGSVRVNLPSYTYDKNDNRLSQTDANNNETSYAYDNNLLTTLTYPGLTTENYGYDARNYFFFGETSIPCFGYVVSVVILSEVEVISLTCFFPKISTHTILISRPFSNDSLIVSIGMSLCTNIKNPCKGIPLEIVPVYLCRSCFHGSPILISCS